MGASTPNGPNKIAKYQKWLPTNCSSVPIYSIQEKLGARVAQ
jgi:hypothetical protein